MPPKWTPPNTYPPKPLFASSSNLSDHDRLRVNAAHYAAKTWEEYEEETQRRFEEVYKQDPQGAKERFYGYKETEEEKKINEVKEKKRKYGDRLKRERMKPMIADWEARLPKERGGELDGFGNQGDGDQGTSGGGKGVKEK